MIRKSGYRFSPRDKREALARRSCSNKKPEQDGDSTIGHLALAAIAQNKFEAEIDMARPGARQHQSGRGSADGITVNADGAEAWRDQPAHFQIAQPNDGDRLLRGRTETQQSGGAQAGHEPVSYTHLTLPTKRIV